MDRRKFLRKATGALGALALADEAAQAEQRHSADPPQPSRLSGAVKTLAPAGKAPGKIYMVTVGVKTYRYGIKGLPSPALDVINIVKSFEGADGELAVLVNGLSDSKFLTPTKQNIEQAVRQLSARVGPNDTFWFYFSGHGISLQEKSYLVPEDARLGPDMAATLISVSGIRAILQKVPARYKALVLDSCQSGSPKAALAGAARWEDVLGSASGVVTMAACQIDQSAIDTGRGSLFTNLLLEGILGRAAPEGEKSITISSLERFVTQKVTEASLGRQTPVFLYKRQEDLAIAHPNPAALERLPSLENQTLRERRPLKPGLIVWIEEEHADAAGNLTRETLLQPMLQSLFIADGFPVLIEEEARNFRVRLTAPDAGAAKQAARQLNSRFLLRGTAKIKPMPKRFEAQADFELVQAQVTAQLIDTEGGDLGTVVALEAGRGVSEASAIKMAMERAADKVHREMVAKVAQLLKFR